MTRRAPRISLAACVVVGMVLAACGGSAAPATATAAPATAAAAAARPPLPASLVSSGVLRVGSQQTYVPAEFRDEGSADLKGFTVDLVTEVAKRLGLKVQYVQADYSALIPGLQADRFDIGSGGMSPNPDRLAAVDMVGYFQSGATFIIRKSDAGKGYQTAQDFCGGKKVGALQGSTTLEAAIKLENEKCVAAGKAPIDLQFFPTTPNGLQQVDLGRIDAYLPDYAQTLYIIKQTPDKYSTIGSNYYLVKYPIVWTVLKTNTQLREALSTTLAGLMSDGTYKRILDTWGVGSGAIKAPAVNSLTAQQ